MAIAAMAYSAPLITRDCLKNIKIIPTTRSSKEIIKIIRKPFQGKGEVEICCTWGREQRGARSQATTTIMRVLWCLER